MGFRDKLLKSLESKVANGKDPDAWLEDLKANLDKSIAKHGVDSEQSRKWRILVCDLLEQRDRRSEARLLWEAQVESLKRTNGSDDLETVNAESRLAIDLGFTGDYREARLLLEHIYEVRIAALGPDDEGSQWAKRQIEMIDGASD
jgi:hypothetical protein